MAISFETFERVVLEDGDDQWELVCGHLQKKPAMTIEHRTAIVNLVGTLWMQLRHSAFLVSTNHTHVGSASSYYVPDLAVIPRTLQDQARAGREGVIDLFGEPLPLVVEVWSPSTGTYDVTMKLPEYQRQRHREIWFIHPYERWLRAWRRQADGTYTQTLFTGDAIIEPVALQGVGVALAALFE
jgi:Uma2 family endonuclease